MISYLSRSAWGAGPLKAGHKVSHEQFKGLVIHHTVMASPEPDLDDQIAYMRRLQKSRPDLGPEVPYSFVVLPGENPTQALIAEGRGWGVTGAHTVGYNSTRYGCAYGGNASLDEIGPGVIEAFNWLGQRLHNPAGAEATMGHRDVKQTECPGNHLYAVLPQIQPPFRPPPEEDDMTDAEHKMVADTNHRVADLVAKVNMLDQRTTEILAAIEALKPSDG